MVVLKLAVVFSGFWILVNVPSLNTHKYKGYGMNSDAIITEIASTHQFPVDASPSHI